MGGADPGEGAAEGRGEGQLGDVVRLELGGQAGARDHRLELRLVLDAHRLELAAQRGTDGQRGLLVERVVVAVAVLRQARLHMRAHHARG